MAEVIQMKGTREAPKSYSSSMETVIATLAVFDAWETPPFQREYKENARVRAIAEELCTAANGGVIDGVITLGEVTGQRGTRYLLDGQHRIGAAKLAATPEFVEQLRRDYPGTKFDQRTEFIVDLRICRFDSLTEMGAEFVRLNSKIRNIMPDDVLRALEGELVTLRTLRKRCPFIGYGNIRRGPSAPIMSMSAAIRCWRGSQMDTPIASASGQSAAEQARDMTKDETESMASFFELAHEAWGNDPSNHRLWGNLNVTMTAWLYRRLVLDRERGSRRYAVLSNEQFKRCLMSLSAHPNYNNWLLGRSMRERDRSPCYGQIKGIFIKRMGDDGITNLKLPSPHWATR